MFEFQKELLKNGKQSVSITMKCRTTASGLVSSCNMDCGCSTKGFEPVCVQEVVYFSPCHAGCLSSDTQNGIKVSLMSTRSFVFSFLNNQTVN